MSTPFYADDLASSESMAKMQPHERLAWARLNAGYSTASDAARALGILVPTYSGHENGQRGFKRSAKRYADFFDVSLDWLLGNKEQPQLRNEPVNISGTHAKNRIAEQSGAVKIKVVGRVAAGVFREIEQMAFDSFPDSPFPPDPQYPNSAQFDLVVEGNSINRFAPDGDVLRCVDINKAEVDLADGDLVVVRKLDADGKVETTAKRARRRNGTWELWCDSTDPAHQGVITLPRDPTAEVNIVAVVLYSYRSARPLGAFPWNA